MAQDDEHLRLLSVFHYVTGGITALFALFPVIHLIVGLFLLLAPERLGEDGGMTPAFVGWFFVVFAAAFIALGWGLAACMIAAGRLLARRRRYLFCLVVAAVECLAMPFGTVLGVFTIIVLTRESVKSMFQPGVQSS